MPEQTMKIIGKRVDAKYDLNSADPFLKMAIELRGNKPFAPKGVYKFKTFEEAQEWWIKMLSRKTTDTPIKENHTS